MEKVQVWTELIKTLSGVIRKHPQYAYAGLQKSLQQEWAFVPWVTPRIGGAFGLAEQALRKTFAPTLLQSLGEGTPRRGVTRLPVKHVVLALPDTTKTAPEVWTASYVITGHLVAALRVQEELWTEDHSICL